MISMFTFNQFGVSIVRLIKNWENYLLCYDMCDAFATLLKIITAT